VDLIGNSNYGAIGNAQDDYRYRAIDPQGRYLAQAAALMPGQQVPARTTVPELQVLSSATGQHVSVHLVNYNLHAERTVTISVTGTRLKDRFTRWELSSRDLGGQVATITGLARISVPPQSIVIVRGQRAA
jgi:hypothetical protein